MVRHLLGFELGQLLRNGVFWIVMAVWALFGFGTMASDNVSFGGGVGNTMRNAPAVVINVLGAFSVFSVLLATIFVAGIAIRDFEQRSEIRFGRRTREPRAQGDFDGPARHFDVHRSHRLTHALHQIEGGLDRCPGKHHCEFFSTKTSYVVGVT